MEEVPSALRSDWKGRHRDDAYGSGRLKRLGSSQVRATVPLVVFLVADDLHDSKFPVVPWPTSSSSTNARLKRYASDAFRC